MTDQSDHVLPSVQRLDLPYWTARAEDEARCLEDIDAWAKAVAASGLIEAFGGEPPSLAGAELLDFLLDFSGRHWDFRGGVERNLASTPVLSAEQGRLTASVAGDLGLDGTRAPRDRHYDAVLLTGGMVRAGIVKPRYLRQLADAGLKFQDGVFLGAFRSFAGDEVVLAQEIGVRGADEFDAMATGMERAFGPLGAPAVREELATDARGSWRELAWQWDESMLRVIAAPSSAPRHRRANTADTFRFWADRHAASARSVLVITTPVYVPYQGAVAVEVLGVERGLAVETVAVSESASDLGELTQEFGPQHQLQELRAALYGMRSLRGRLAAS